MPTVPAHLAADERFLREGLDALIEHVRSQPPAPATPARCAHPTVRDILQGEERTGCLYGKTVLCTVRSTGSTALDRRTCKRRNCAYCIPYVLRQRVISRALAVWDGAPVYRAVFISYQDWRTSKRGERFRHDYAGLYFSARQLDGTVIVLFPGLPGEGDPVDEHPGEAIFYATLGTEATGRQLTLPKLPPAPTSARDDADEPGASDRLSQLIPYTVSALQAQTILPGHSCHVSDLGRVNGYVFAQQVVSAVLGREDWQRDLIPSPHHFYRLIITGLTPEEIDSVRAAIQPLHDLYLEEQAERRRLSQAAKAAQAAAMDLQALHGGETPW